MITLVNTSLFSFNKTYDYQSVCDPERETKAAAGLRSVYVVKKFILSTSLENHQCTIGFVVNFRNEVNIFDCVSVLTVASIFVCLFLAANDSRYANCRLVGLHCGLVRRDAAQ